MDPVTDRGSTWTSRTPVADMSSGRGAPRRHALLGALVAQPRRHALLGALVAQIWALGGAFVVPVPMPLTGGRGCAPRAGGAAPLMRVAAGGDSVLAQRVRDALWDDDGDAWPYLGDNGKFGLSECVAYGDGLQDFTGRERYEMCAAAWKRQLIEEAPDAVVTIVRVAQVGPETVNVRYNISWTPPNAAWLVTLGNAVPGWRVIKVDLLHRLRERSKFRWKAVVDLFWRAATTGDLLVPLAVIQCTASLAFDTREGLPTLRRHRETFDLLQSVYSGELQNRALARDLLLFLDTRQPPGMSLDEWNDEVETRVNIQSVPGMGQFDIDGLEPEEQSDLVSGGLVALGYLTISALVVAAAIGSVYFGRIEEARKLQREVDLLQEQLGESLFLVAAALAECIKHS